MGEITKINLGIGRRISEIRKAANMTQADLAEKLDYSTNHFSSIERGVIPLSIDTLTQICTIFNISADQIIFGDKSSGIAGPILSRAEELDPSQIKNLERIIDIFIDSVKTHQ